MKVRVWRHPVLPDEAGGDEVVHIESGLLADILARLESAAGRILAELDGRDGGAARWAVFVNGERVMVAAGVWLEPGDELAIVPAVRGGF